MGPRLVEYAMESWVRFVNEDWSLSVQPLNAAMNWHDDITKRSHLSESGQWL